jgi:hypothetical protein
MKILFVSGDDDFAAVTFENEVGLKKAKELLAEGKPIEGEGFIAKVLEFGEVDQKFIDFISDEIQDYDDSKHKNFYVL